LEANYRENDVLTTVILCRWLRS